MTPSDSARSTGDEALGTIESDAHRFVWSPPIAAAAIRARRRMRMLSVTLITITALWAALSVWNDGADAVVFALVVPLMLLGAAAIVDRVFAIATRLRLEVSDDRLTITRSKRRDLLDRASIVDVSVRSQSADDRQRRGPSGWAIVIDRRDASTLTVWVPMGLGSRFGRAEAARLEAELRRRLLD